MPDPLPVLGIMIHEHDRVSDFVPIASLLEWQWHRIVMRNGQFYHSSRNGASQTVQCREIPHTFPEPFYPVLQVRVGDPTTHPPPLYTCHFCQKLGQVQQILERPSEGGGGSTQVQIWSYRNRQSGNLARKVRNTSPGLTALRL